jgi:hypothetical protein
MKFVGIVLHALLVALLFAGGIGLQMVPNGRSVLVWWLGAVSWVIAFIVYITLIGLGILKRNS